MQLPSLQRRFGCTSGKNSCDSSGNGKPGHYQQYPGQVPLLVGIQEKTPESLPCEDRTDHALLLHFWPLTVRVYVPELINRKGEREFVGFVLAVPEVNDILAFGLRLSCLAERIEARDLRISPCRSSVISLPAR